jgi:hypothetical protein
LKAWEETQMNYADSAINTAARFGEIPFAAFTSDLLTSTFKALIDAHVTQLHEYQNFIQAITVSLSDYINNTIDSVSMAEITRACRQLGGSQIS